jgi:tetratricopeptide (TPR) repeat protein
MALHMLADWQPSVPLEVQVSFYGSLVYERWSRAELLRELGRFDEALRWYRSMAETSVHELAYLAPSHLRRAQIYEQLGDRARASYHYSRFATLWSRCDPALRPMVADARRRAALLAKSVRPLATNERVP